MRACALGLLIFSAVAAAQTAKTDIPEYLIPWLKLPDVPANRFHPPCYISAQSYVFGFEQPSTHEANQEYVSGQEMPVILIYGRRVNFD